MSKLVWRTVWRAVWRTAAVGIVLAAIFIAGYVVAVNGKPSLTINIPYDRIEALLAAATLTLFFATILISMIGIFGWNEIRSLISREVERIVKKESVGSIKLTTGLFYGRMSRIDEPGGSTVKDKDLLRTAIKYSREALELLEGTDGEIRAKNNLAFYLALDPDPLHATNAVELSRDLLKYAGRSKNLTVFNTYGAVVGAYPTYYTKDEVEHARDLLQAIVDREGVDPSEKENARRHVTALNRALSAQLKPQL
jgi:hypothetical protein